MKAILIAGIVWGLLYFGFGVLSSFTLNGIDFWGSITILGFTFLFPLPLAIVAIWYPKSTSVALFLSTILCVTVIICMAGVREAFTASPGVRLYIPHVIFALVYVISGSFSKKANSES
jgi:hypothetical protein